jgi:RimJ/RimL family protein N-acetyltransferase
VLHPAFPIATERLWLRPFAERDLDWLERLHSDPDVIRHVPWEPRSRAELLPKLARTALAQEGDALNLAAVLPASDEPVGDVSLFWTSAEHEQGEIGYLLDRAHQGRGYATEAARALLRLGFEAAGFHRIIARLDARNDASAQVAERLGMRREALLVQNERIKGEWTDELVYAMLASEWATSAEVLSKRSA